MNLLEHSLLVLKTSHFVQLMLLILSGDWCYSSADYLSVNFDMEVLGLVYVYGRLVIVF